MAIGQHKPAYPPAPDKTLNPAEFSQLVFHSPGSRDAGRLFIVFSHQLS